MSFLDSLAKTINTGLRGIQLQPIFHYDGNPKRNLADFAGVRGEVHFGSL